MVVLTPVWTGVIANAQTPAPSAPPAEVAPSTSGPGALDAVGRWLGSGVQSLGAGAGDAAATVGRWTGALVTGREPCPISANGAPDCGRAAAALCRAKGYGGGTSIDFEESWTCAPPARTPARPADGAQAKNTRQIISESRDAKRTCGNEHIVTRAMCR